MSIKSIVFLSILGLMALSSWLMTRRSRAILQKSLGRDIREGEETSLRAWMSVPDATLRTAHEEIGANPAEQILGALESAAPPRVNEPRSDNLSIR